MFVHSGASLPMVSKKRLNPRRTGNDWKLEGSNRCFDCKWNNSCDWRSNILCLWLGHMCSSSIIERITSGSLARLLVWMASESTIKYHQEWRAPINTAHTAQFSLFTSAERIARAWLKNCSIIFVRMTRVLSSVLIHDSSLLVVASTAVHHEHFLFLIHSSLYHDTRTRTTFGSTRSTPRTPSASSTSPGSPSRRATLSRTTLAWKPTAWRKPAQHILHSCSSEHQSKALNDGKRSQAAGDHERSVETELPEWLQPVTDGLTRWFSQVRQTYLQLTWPCYRQHFLLPRILQQNQLRTGQEESTICLLIFPKTRIARYADARRSRERHAEEIRKIGRTEVRLPKFSMKTKSLDSMTDM